MCGRYTLTQLAADASKMVIPKGVKIDVVPRYNIAPSQYCPVIPQADHTKIHWFKWGLIPHWLKNINTAHNMINARAETLVEKAAFKHAADHRRCLVLADSFYEWKPHGSNKQPYRIMLKSGEKFFFAGISETWEGITGEILETFSIITTTPNSLMQDIHDRMPVILNRQDARKWISLGTATEDKTYLLRPYDSDLMEAYPVSPRVNAVKHDSKDLIQRFVPPPTLF